MKLTANMEVEQNATLNTQKNTPTLLALSFSFLPITALEKKWCFVASTAIAGCIFIHFTWSNVHKISENLLSL